MRTDTFITFNQIPSLRIDARQVVHVRPGEMRTAVRLKDGTEFLTEETCEAVTAMIFAAIREAATTITTTGTPATASGEAHRAKPERRGGAQPEGE